MHIAPISSEFARACFAKREDRHKYDYGHVVVLAGGRAKGGAARLAARSALRAGAGLVTVLAPPEAMAENAARLDAVMLAEIADPGALAAYLAADARVNAVVLGPGFGVERARGAVPVALAARRALTLDADALSAWADDPPRLFSMLHPQVAMTPHLGEFRRLFPDLAGDLAAGRIDADEAARRAAARAGCVVLLKGARTVIARPDGGVRVHDATGPAAAPWLATAGSGDVLAGAVGAMMARGLDAFDAASAAAWLHAEAARSFGPGLIAEDLPERYPPVFRDLGL